MPEQKKSLLVDVLREGVERHLRLKGNLGQDEHLDPVSFEAGMAAGMSHTYSMLEDAGMKEAANFIITYMEVSAFSRNAPNN